MHQKNSNHVGSHHVEGFQGCLMYKEDRYAKTIDTSDESPCIYIERERFFSDNVDRAPNTTQERHVLLKNTSLASPRVEEDAVQSVRHLTKVLMNIIILEVK